jgi:glycerol-3-phosphate dehydrogenase (NAD(P)+)
MEVITVLGAGMMGSALCVPLSDRGHEVRLVGTHLDDEIVASLRATGFHPKLGIELPRSIHAYPHRELVQAMEGVSVIGLGVSSAGLEWAGVEIAPFVRPERPIVMITKGLGRTERGLRVLPDVVKDCWPPELRDRVSPAAVGGPCIAGELARRAESCVVLCGRDGAVLQKLAALMRTDYYHVTTSTDVVGVQVCAALKNAYAMGIAFALGVHEQRGGKSGSVALHNFESAVFAQAVLELRRLVTSLGGDSDTVCGLPGVGDLDVTCNGGRTGRFGRLLGLGLGVDQAVARMEGATLECLEILQILREALPDLPERGASLPLLQHLMEVALDGAPVAVPFDRFFAS